MLEFLLCSLVTILPDFLFRRYWQGKRVGREINLFSVWYELRYGIVSCLVLAVMLITVIFYFHPSTKTAVSFFRTVTILPDAPGRVAEVFVKNGDIVQEGQPLFRLDNQRETAAIETARKQAAEIDAAIVLAETDLTLAEARLAEAGSSYDQALRELETMTELGNRGSSAVSERDIEKLEITVRGRQASVNAAHASVDAAQAQLKTVLPARKATAEAALAEAQIVLDRTTVRAGVAGSVEQFVLRPGDILNPMLRAAGVLMPTAAGRLAVHAGFGQIEAQVIKVGMVGEISCISMPFTVTPMVVTAVQDAIAAGQIRSTDQLFDPTAARVPGTIVVSLEPLYEGGLDKLPPGSSCIANVYTSNHDRLANEDLGTMTRFALHAVDATGVAHAAILRMQTLMLPIRTLVLSGH
jgi:multidrug resistance efflux pump